jgi:vancomycin resistance protein VanJ
MEDSSIPMLRPVAATGNQRASRPSGRLFRNTLTICCWMYPLGLLMVWLLVRTAGDRWWPATLLMFGPRWASAIPLPIFAAAALGRRSRLIWPVLAAAVLQLFPIMGLCVPVHHLLSRNANTPALRILTLNAHGGQTSGAQLDALLAQEKPDVVLIQDWAKRLRVTFYTAPGWYTRWDAEHELFVASRFPIADGRDLDLEDLPADGLSETGRETPGEAAHYVLDAPIGHVHLFNVHLASPHVGFNSFLKGDPGASARIDGNSLWRRRESAAIIAETRSLSGPVLLAGDFNTPVESDIFRSYWWSYTDAFSECGMGFGDTFYARRAQMRIDHILIGPGWRAQRCWVGPDVGSPHRPVIADLAWMEDPRH